eukprot:gb/GEZJ01005298.1/.p1 GENE.gb/GEZJ01005298.1/~~gb/GEZJ01005298.1/.p1  ORF type:complete len:132 (-),score=10.21 gb/GEZJ01005298.1/:124-519(-)
MNVAKTTITLTFILSLLTAQLVQCIPPLVTNKCWQQSEQCCYENVPCGWRCREWAGYKHCWRKLCSALMCTRVHARRSKPFKPEDEIDWKTPVITDCTLHPTECGNHPVGLDYNIVQEELPVASDKETLDV